MLETVHLLLAWIAGTMLGTLFFGGLWWTIRRGVTSNVPAVWFLGSLLLRTVIVLAGFYFASGNQWLPLLTCLLGFVGGRFMVALTIQPLRELLAAPLETPHAP